MHRIVKVFGFMVLAALASEPSWAKRPFVSPDGHKIAFVDEPHDAESEKRQIVVVDVECLFTGKSREECKSIVFEGASVATGRIVWAKDSSSFIRTAIDRLWFTSISGTGAQPTRYWGQGPIDPTTFDPSTFPGRDKRPDGLVDADTEEWKIFNAQGDLVGEVLYKDDDSTLIIPDGPSVVIPHEIAWRSVLAPAKYLISPAANGRDVFFWSSSMGANGFFERIGPSGTIEIAVPKDLFGPASPIWDVPTGEPIALVDPFSIIAINGHGKDAAWLAEAAAKLRRANPGLEFVDVSLTLDGQTAVVRGVKGLNCEMTYVVRPSQTVALDKICRGEDLGEPKVSPATITSTGQLLKGRLYSWNDTRPADGLLVVFGGGPQFNSTIPRPATAAEALRGTFDILVVDYRGSIGFGWENLTALHQPISDVVEQDLRTTLDWGQRFASYKGKPIGFWGDSFGGHAGLSALTRQIGGLSFVISNSGFIEDTEEKRARNCREVGWVAMVFGVTKTNDGKCAYNAPQLGNEAVRSATPLLMLIGEKDVQSQPVVAHNWITRAKMEGACVGVISSVSGGHALQWEKPQRMAAMASIRNWVEEVLNGKQTACGLQSDLP
jgi:hypothetical protein